MGATFSKLDVQGVQTIRGLSLDGVDAARSGHPGLPLGAAPMAHVLWTRHLRFDPADPSWPNRDRFVLSAGHGSMLQYALLHLTGFDLPLEELQNFRQLHSKTPGHPENTLTPGVELATGPLGQGIAHAVGMAIAEAFLSATFNRPDLPVFDHFTYVICSDGDLMEGVSNEACSLAGHLGLGKLIVLYDDNGVTIDGPTSLAFTEDVEGRYNALGWQTIRIDGMDLDAVDRALEEAKAETTRPTLILAKTIIGFGSPNLAGTNKAHSNPFGPTELKATKVALGISLEPFDIPTEVLEFYRRAGQRSAGVKASWVQTVRDHLTLHPDLASTLEAALINELPVGWQNALPSIVTKQSTRKSSESVLLAISDSLPTLIGGSADLAESNLTTQKGKGDFQAETPVGKTIHFGVREHAMAAAVNGMNLHGGVRAFGASFLVFSDYARPSIRLAALMQVPSIFIFTHDSVGVGEDGPTHQPVEHLTALRAIPNLNVIRPCDGNETAVAWKLALESQSTPTLLALSRQVLPPLTTSNILAHPAHLGGYILREAPAKNPEVVLIGTGSEVQHCVAAQAVLAQHGVRVRVVSLPSWFLFDQQPRAYREMVLPKEVLKVSLEAGTTLAWARYADVSLGVDTFGHSAPGHQVMAEFGITAYHLVELVLSHLVRK